MGKAKKKKGKRQGDGKDVPKASEPLAPAVKAFSAGDYGETRQRLGDKLAEGTLNDADRRRAEDLVEATKLDRGTLLTALACFGVFILAVVVGIAVQP